MNPTKALYVDWSAPKKYSGNNSLFKKPWEIAMIVRSTHFSKIVNNLSPVLYCDPVVYEYYKNTGLCNCFDEIHSVLPDNPPFNPSIFWAAGKFYAMRDMKENFLMIDLDAEIRFKLDLSESDLFCSHVEDIYAEDLNFYPPPEYLDVSGFLRHEYSIEWDTKAYNTSILYFKDLRIAHEYSNKALEFIESISTINPAFEKGYILLVEQRFLYEFAKSKNLITETLISGLYKPGDIEKKIPSTFLNSNVEEVGRKGFFHVWGFKNQIHGTEDAEKSLFGQLIASRFELRDIIVSCVIKNRELYSIETFKT
jgi:hypothetical protein